MLILTITVELDGEQRATEQVTGRRIARDAIMQIGQYDEVLSVSTKMEERT